MKAVRSFETSGINTPAATLHWIYCYSDRTIRNAGFSSQDKKKYKFEKIKKAKNFLCCSFVCLLV
jgi:hypothetical protein